MSAHIHMSVGEMEPVWEFRLHETFANLFNALMNIWYERWRHVGGTFLTSTRHPSVFACLFYQLFIGIDRFSTKLQMELWNFRSLRNIYTFFTSWLRHEEYQVQIIDQSERKRKTEISKYFLNFNTVCANSCVDQI